MKRTILIGLGLIATLLLLAGCASTQTPQPSQQPPATPNSFAVSIKEFKFTPAEVTISQGSTVTWTNQDDVGHTVKFAFEESGFLEKGETYSYTFNNKGNFDYECGPHPFMKGKVVVT